MRTMERDLDRYSRAAEAGRDDAQFRLGLLYSCGSEGVSMDYIQAHMWLNVAAQNGNRRARDLRREVAGDMSHDEVSEAQRRAREWLDTRH